MSFLFESGEVSRFDKREYQRDYNKSAQGKASRKKYRHDNSKHTTDQSYLSRKIVAVDGEGLNITRGKRKGDHIYIMLAISDCEPLISEAAAFGKGLNTRDILQYLWGHLQPENINVIYGGSYDFNLWIRDLLHDEVKAVYKSSYGTPPIWYEEFGLRWIKGKAFEITDGKRTITINDVISFFQRPFIQACDEYLGTYEGREQLVREKARRGNFRADEIASISDYNQLELRLLVDLVGELRQRLNRVGLRPRRWNSPGAIASALFLREGVKDHRNEYLPPGVMEAARYAYAGGRFEMIKYGAVQKDVYEYDLNSAYPRALLNVPSLANSRWIHSEKWDSNVSDFAMYRVRFTGTRADIPAPIFVRGENGTIAYPLNAINWIWSPELESLIEYCKVVEGATFEVFESWVCIPATDYKPFHFIAPLYRMRQKLKALKDGAHVGIKLALNSLYGKLAQQVGWKAASGRHPVRVPTYHQLEWAGYVTSWCRSRVLLAALTNIESVIAFETDALFTTEPLNVDTGEGLGQWGMDHFRSLTYVQSGHYYGTLTDGEEVVKCRGVDKGFISRAAVEQRLTEPESTRTLQASLTRFYGVGIALARGLDAYWCRWLTEPKQLQLMPTGKRIHAACKLCESTSGTGMFSMGEWHSTICPVTGGYSHEYPVEWINPNPNMSELAEMRESENFFDN